MFNIDIITVAAYAVTGRNNGVIVISRMTGKRNMATFTSKRGTTAAGRDRSNNIRITATMTTTTGKTLIINVFDIEIGAVTIKTNGAGTYRGVSRGVINRGMTGKTVLINTTGAYPGQNGSLYHRVNTIVAICTCQTLIIQMFSNYVSIVTISTIVRR